MQVKKDQDLLSIGPPPMKRSLSDDENPAEKAAAVSPVGTHIKISNRGRRLEYLFPGDFFISQPKAFLAITRL